MVWPKTAQIAKAKETQMTRRFQPSCEPTSIWNGFSVSRELNGAPPIGALPLKCRFTKGQWACAVMSDLAGFGIMKQALTCAKAQRPNPPAFTSPAYEFGGRSTVTRPTLRVRV